MEAVFLFYKDESRRDYIQENTKPFQSEWQQQDVAYLRPYFC